MPQSRIGAVRRWSRRRRHQQRADHRPSPRPLVELTQAIPTVLRQLRAATIIRAVADAAERWSDADFPPRVRATAVIVTRLGLSLPVVEDALDRLFFSLSASAIEAAIVAELGSLAVLDDATQRVGGRSSDARGVDRVAIVACDSTIGVTVVPTILALCAKCDVGISDRNDTLIRAFLESLAHEQPEFAQAAVVRQAPGNDTFDDDVLGGADVVIAFGSAAALQAIRAHVRAGARFVPIDARASVGYVDVSRVPPDHRTALLDGIAADALRADAAGAPPLQALFVAGPPSRVASFAADLRTALDRAAIEFPPGPSAGAGGDGGLAVVPIADRDESITYLREHALSVATIGVVDPHATAARELAQALGATRIAQFGDLHTSPFGGCDFGMPRIADFVRWIDRK